MDEFRYSVSRWAPFRNEQEAERVRRISREKITSHPNEGFRIHVLSDEEIGFARILDLFSRIKESDDRDEKLVLILPNPHPQYIRLASLINKLRVNCRNLFIFNMDEWADEEGREAPETWPRGFMYAMKHNFFLRIDADLRPPENHIQGPTRQNIASYGQMIDDAGGAALCDGGIGWSGHVAFIDPGAPEFEGSFDDWKRMGPRLVTLGPFTLAQTCIDADFGMSGDWTWVPPKAYTVGPRQVIGARLRNSWNHFRIASTDISWQRFTVRLAMHGPICRECPASILQYGPTNMYLSEGIAADIEEHQGTLFYA
jgi:glucosamine-6-phosphate deaminase